MLSQPGFSCSNDLYPGTGNSSNKPAFTKTFGNSSPRNEATGHPQMPQNFRVTVFPLLVSVSLYVLRLPPASWIVTSGLSTGKRIDPAQEPARRQLEQKQIADWSGIAGMETLICPQLQRPSTMATVMTRATCGGWKDGYGMNG